MKDQAPDTENNLKLRTVDNSAHQTSNEVAHQERAWHQQFWPWFLIALPGSVVIAAMATLYIAHRHADDLVTGDYYKRGLSINERLTRQDNAKALGIVADLLIHDMQVQVRVQSPLSQSVLHLEFAHPAEADHDFAISLNQTAPGLYLGELRQNVSPNWHWVLTDEDRQWRINSTLSSSSFLDQGVL